MGILSENTSQNNGATSKNKWPLMTSDLWRRMTSTCLGHEGCFTQKQWLKLRGVHNDEMFFEALYIFNQFHATTYL